MPCQVPKTVTLKGVINIFKEKPQANNCINRAITRDWFKENYELIVFGKGVTTIRDECSGGEWSLSPFGARCTVF